MGCCVSSHENRASEAQKQSRSSELHQQFPRISKSPPRPEEESVKEVLSETPKPKPRPDSDPKPMFKIPKNVVPKTEHPELEEDEQRPTKPKIVLAPKKTRPGLPDPTPVAPACSTTEEISDLSEMCSFSESISTSTLREREEDELSQVQQWSSKPTTTTQRVYRSQGQASNFTRNNNRSFRSPAKRAESPAIQRRNPSPNRVQRREPGENSGKRSGSPATRSANVGRSPSGRRTGPPPGRVRMVHGPDPNEGVKKVVEEREREAEEDVERRERESESEWQGPNESLENPLVSLECFIFL